MKTLITLLFIVLTVMLISMIFIVRVQRNELDKLHLGLAKGKVEHIGYEFECQPILNSRILMDLERQEKLIKDQILKMRKNIK